MNTDKLIGLIEDILSGKTPDLNGYECSDSDTQRLCLSLKKLISAIIETRDFIVPLSQGNLNDLHVSPCNFLSSPFRELHSRLLHLTWQASQVAKGDYSQRVDFMGEFSDSFNAMVSALDQKEKMLKEKISQLEASFQHIKKLEGVLPICSSCKKIRNHDTDPEKQENWINIEQFISHRSEARFSHSLCPECLKKLYPDL